MSINVLALSKNARWKGGKLLENSDNMVNATDLKWADRANEQSGYVSFGPRMLEDGSNKDVLFTHPMWVSQGTIKGWHEWKVLPEQAVLKVEFGFSQGAENTDGVNFQIWEHHNLEDGRETWTKVLDVYKTYDRQLKQVNVDLSHLSGQKVGIELRVDAGGHSGQDWACWSQVMITSGSNNLVAKIVRNAQPINKESQPRPDESHPEYICTSTFQRISGTTPDVLLLNPNSDFVWPGHIIEIASIANGGYTSAKIPSENILPITISNSNLRLEASSSATMHEPRLASYRDILKAWHQNTKEGEDPANIVGNIKSFYSHADLDFQLRAAYKSVAHNIAGGVSFGSDSKTNKLFVDIRQVYYTVDVSNRYFELLKESVDHDNFGYISSIKYGRIIVITFESEYTHDELRAAIDYTNGKVGEKQNKKTKPNSGGKLKDSNGNLLREQTGVDLDARYSQILKSTKIRAMVIGGPSKPVSSILNISGSVADVAKKIVNLLEAGSSTSLQSPPAPVSYTIKFLSDGSNANILMSTAYNVRQCRKVEDGIFEVILDSIVCTNAHDADPAAGIFDPTEDLYGSIVAFAFKKKEDRSKVESEFLWKASRDNYQVIEHQSRLRINRAFRFTIEDFQSFKDTAYIEIQSNIRDRDWTNDDDEYGGVVRDKIYLKNLEAFPQAHGQEEKEVEVPSGTQLNDYKNNKAASGTKIMFLRGGDEKRARIEIWYRVNLIS